jgi:outer membrane protein assembly factor BamB
MNAARQRRLELCACRLALGLLICLSFSVAGADWPSFRGPTHDGVSTDRLNRQWTGSVTNPLWRVVVNNCLGSLSVSSGRVFTQTVRSPEGTPKEYCIALNATNGVELWATPVDIASYPEGGVGFDDGPRSTPVVSGDSVFVLTSYLKLFRLNVTNGGVIWQKDLVSEYGAVVIGWQNAASPVIENGLIYLNASCGSSTLMALRTSDGGVAWRTQNEEMTHATPALTTIHGVRQIIFPTQSSMVSLEPVTGNLLWRFTYPFTYGTSLGVSPVVCDDMVFICGAQSYNMGSAAARISLTNGTWGATQLWANLGVFSTLSSHWMTPVCSQGFLYGPFGVQSFDSPNAQLKCVDIRTGSVKWSINGFGRGASTLVDGQLVTITESGQLVLARAVTNAYTELARFTAIPNYHSDTNKCWNMPAVSDGRLFIRSSAFVAAYDLSVPPLKVDAPRLTGVNGFELSIRTATGVPVASNRLAGMEVRATTNLSLSLTQWNILTNSLVLTGGAVRVQNIGTGTHTQRFFIVTEPK